LAKNDYDYDDDNDTDKYSNPVTVILKRVAKRDKIKEFEEWLSGISKEVSGQNGNMGIDIIKPTINSKSKSEYVIIFRFNKYDNLISMIILKNIKVIHSKWVVTKRYGILRSRCWCKKKGLEFWFTPYLKEDSSSANPLNPPPRYKMAIVTIPIISILPLTLVPQINVLTVILLIHYSKRLVIGITITVLLMTYVTMPLLTRILKFRLLKP